MSGEALFRYDLSLSGGPGYTGADLDLFRGALARATEEAEGWGMHVHGAQIQLPPEEMSTLESDVSVARIVKVVVSLTIGAEGS